MKTMNANPSIPKIVTNRRLLGRMERAGFITRPDGGRFLYVDNDPQTFTYKGRAYLIAFQDGCFFPFVFDMGPA